MPNEKELKNLKEIAQRIKQATHAKEKIILYGDSDMDGASSVFLLRRALEYLESDYKGDELCKTYFPDREKDGYGLNIKAVDYLTQFAPALLITLDCGIGNINEVEQAQGRGLETIIIDHHRVLPELPKARFILDPHQDGDSYLFKEFSNAGLVYKLCRHLINDKKIFEEFIVIVALANIADMVKNEDENKDMTEAGLSRIFLSGNKALSFLIQSQNFENKDRQELTQKITIPLNSAGNIDNQNETYLFLRENDDQKIQEKCGILMAKSEEKQKTKKKTLEEAITLIEKGEKNLPFIFVGSKSWQLVSVGSIASEIQQKYDKAAFLYVIGEAESTGSIRAGKNINSVEILIYCKDLLVTYGGHPPASGFRIRNDNLEKFKERIAQYYEKFINGKI